mgnify:CR=1 FL=1
MRSSSAARFSILFLSVATLVPSPAYSNELITQGRLGAFGGAWMSWFREGGGGVNAQTQSQIRPGMEFTAGLQVSFVIVEYVVTYLPWIRSSNAAGRLGDAVYYSFLGGNVGFDIPFLPLEVYAGGDAGTYLFTSGTSNEFSGPVLRLGTNLFIGDKTRIVLKAEYLRAFLLGDRGGWLPDGFSASADVVFVSLGFQFGFGSDANAPKK